MCMASSGREEQGAATLFLSQQLHLVLPSLARLIHAEPRLGALQAHLDGRRHAAGAGAQALPRLVPHLRQELEPSAPGVLHQDASTPAAADPWSCSPPGRVPLSGSSKHGRLHSGKHGESDSRHAPVVWLQWLGQTLLAERSHALMGLRPLLLPLLHSLAACSRL